MTGWSASDRKKKERGNIMSTAVANPSKWFSNKSLRIITLTLLHPRAKSSPAPSSSTPSPVVTTKSSTKEEELQRVFRHFDADGDGKISSEEVDAYFASIGEAMPQDKVRKVINDFATNGDNLLEFSDFVRLVEGDKANDDDLRSAFEMFEAQKGDGCITPRGLQKMLNRLGDPKSFEECAAMIRAFDVDGNGVLDFHEFHRMMT